MKKILFAFIGTTILSASLLLAGCSKDDDDGPDNNGPQVVTIPDARLALEIRTKLNIAATDSITTADMEKLDTLNIDAGSVLARADISSLEGLQYAENLVYLHFGSTNVTDLTPIKDLKKVAYLRLNNTKVTSLAPIAGYTSLTYFNANSVNTITDISPLAGNTGIQEIILRDVPFGNPGMATLKNFTVMYRINMRNTGVTDISVLAELMEAGALQNTTPGAAAAGGADLDLRQLSGIDCSLLDPYKENISNMEGC